MNYIKLINSFYDRLETNSLSTSAIALWHALVHVNNKAGWQREFSVAVSVLCVKTDLSERTITNARNDLKLKGYIDFKSRKGSKSAIYTLIDLSAINADKLSYNVSDNLSYNPSDNLSALIKLNETKQNETKKEEEKAPSENPFTFYEQNGFGVLGSHISEKVSSWCEDLSDALVIEAMKIACERGAKSFTYVESILRDWADKKIKTVSEAHASILAFKDQQSKQRTKPRQGSGYVRQENVPDWLKNKDDPKPDTISSDDSDLEERKKAVEERLGRLRAGGL